MGKVFYSDETTKLIHGDSFRELKKIESNSIDFVFADPPYFLSSNGITCSGGKMVSVNKGKWDEEKNLQEKLKFNDKWLKECYRVLKENGTIAISGTFHNIYTLGVSLEKNKFDIINNITWQKNNPPPNISCRALTHSTETVLWAKKKGKKHTFNYSLMKEINGGKQMKDVWTFPLTKKSEKKMGKHPTQKPLALMERLILLSTDENSIVLDPFSGSGTTGVACKKLNRQYIGIEKEKEYVCLSKKRIEETKREALTYEENI